MSDTQGPLPGDSAAASSLSPATVIAARPPRDHQNAEGVGECAGGNDRHGQESLSPRAAAVVRLGVVSRIVAEAFHRQRLSSPGAKSSQARSGAVADGVARLEAARPKRLAQRIEPESSAGPDQGGGVRPRFDATQGAVQAGGKILVRVGPRTLGTAPTDEQPRRRTVSPQHAHPVLRKGGEAKPEHKGGIAGQLTLDMPGRQHLSGGALELQVRSAAQGLSALPP